MDTVVKIEIKSRVDGTVIYRGEHGSLREAVETAVEHGVSLADAKLVGAVLTGTRLVGANLARANLTGASLVDARLVGANLTRANLAGASLVDARLGDANLTRANLDCARLYFANLVGANLAAANLANAMFEGANLTRANLDGARLDGANLACANLDGVRLDGARLDTTRGDVRALISAAPREAPALLTALRAGRVNGSCYHGECACLYGTIAKARAGRVLHGTADVVFSFGSVVRPDPSRLAERCALAIRQGDTPETSPVVALTARWIEEWIAEQAALT
jgi:hypothetical protein